MPTIRIALVDDDRQHAELLTVCLHAQGHTVQLFGDSNELLADAGAFDHDFYLIDLGLPGIDGVDLIKILRRRTDAGVIVLSGRIGEAVFASVIGAGADMHLVKPLPFDLVAVAIDAVQRRIAGSTKPVATGGSAWQLDRHAGALVAPGGHRVNLSSTDERVLQCFVEAQGEPVPRDTLLQRLGHDPVLAPDAADGLNATIYRLRRRIERGTAQLLPLQAKSRVGYVFKAPLVSI